MRTCTFVLCLLVIPLLAACAQQEPDPRPIRNLRTMVVGDISDIRNAQLPGRARSADEVDLSFDVSGTVIERPVSIGSKVEKGDLIARLDPRDFQAQVRSAEADARNAQSNFARGSELLKDKFISEAEYDRLKARVDITQATLDVARKALSDSEIYAPFSGVIVNLSVENFQSVLAKSPIARLLGMDTVEMVINVSESQIANLHHIEKLEVEFDALPGLRLPATITEVGREASLTTRTFPVTLSMAQPDDQKVMAGMAGTAFASTGVSAEETSGYIIPAGAVFGEAVGNLSKVWVVGADSTVTSRAIVVGRVTAGGVEVTEGLNAGDRIATAGLHTLAEGQQVNVAGAEG